MEIKNLKSKILKPPVIYLLITIAILLGVLIVLKVIYDRSDTFNIVEESQDPNEVFKTCSYEQYDNFPNVGELLEIVDEPSRVRLLIDTISGDRSVTTGYVGDHKYTLEGKDFWDEDNGKLIDFVGEGYSSKGLEGIEYFDTFKVDSFVEIRLTVLTGTVSKQQICDKECEEYYEFETYNNGLKYIFTLREDGINLNTLEEGEARLAGILGFDDISTQNRVFFVREICE